jgi:hypothetical protein
MILLTSRAYWAPPGYVAQLSWYRDEFGRLFTFDALYSDSSSSWRAADHGPYPILDSLLVLWNPVRKEAIPLFVNSTLITGSNKWAKDPEWRKDALIVIYRITKTGRRGRAIVDVNLSEIANTEKKDSS